MVRNRVVDIVQPDLNYNGGFIRAARVARLAAAAGLRITPHSSGLGANPVYMLNCASCTANMSEFQEYNAAPHKKNTWFEPALEVEKGVVPVPKGPGLGLTIDPDMLRKAERL